MAASMCPFALWKSWGCLDERLGSRVFVALRSVFFRERKESVHGVPVSDFHAGFHPGRQEWLQVSFEPIAMTAKIGTARWKHWISARVFLLPMAVGDTISKVSGSKQELFVQLMLL